MTCQQITQHIRNLATQKKAFDEACGMSNPDIKTIFSIKEEIDSIIEIVDKIQIDIETARKLMGKDFIGPDEVRSAFLNQVEIPSVLPLIPFTRRELKRAKELGQVLILHSPVTMAQIKSALNGKLEDESKLLNNDDITDWYEDKSFFNTELSRADWTLITKEVLPGSLGKNYLEQTQILINYLQNDVFKDKVMPKQYTKAVAEFQNYIKANPDFADRITSDDEPTWKAAAEKLESFQITQLTRPSPVEVLYFIAAYFQTTGERLLKYTRTWTGRHCHDIGFVDLGYFDTAGVRVSGRGPGGHSFGLGVSLSRIR